MPAVELAAAYISIVPSAAGMKRAIEQELAGLDLDLDIGAGARGAAAGQEFGRSFADKAKDLIAGVGVAASAALAAGFANSMDQEVGSDKLAASLGLSPAQAKEAGEVASRVYVGAWGDSLGEVNDAVGSVMSTLGRFTSGSAEIETMTTRAIDFAKAFDSDVNTAVGNAGILLETGLAKTGTEAFDLLVAGMQRVPVAFRDELTEATQEYSQFFAGFGFTGQEAMGVLVEASKGGTYMVDKVGDSIKEATIKLRDGNKETGNALASMFGGLNVDGDKLDRVRDKVVKLREDVAKAGKMPAGDKRDIALAEATKKLTAEEENLRRMSDGARDFGLKLQQLQGDLAAGGPKAKAAFGEIATAITQIQDPVEKSKAAIAVFGTPFEDISGDATKMDALLKTLATGSMTDVTGAGERMGDVLNDNSKGKIDSFMRTIEVRLTGVASAIGPVGAALPALGGLTTVLQSGAAAAVKNTAAMIAHKTATLAVAAATKAAAVAQGIFNAVMALNPVVLVVLAVVALVAAIVLAYQKVEWFRNFVDGAFRVVLGAVKAVVSWVTDNWPLLLAILTGPIGIAVGLITRNWDTIKDGFTAVKNWIGDRIGDVVGFFTGLKDRIGRIASGIFDPLRDGFKAIVNGIIGLWNNIDFGIHIRVPDWVPLVGGKGFDVDDIFPDIPTFARGGTVPGPRGAPQLIVAHGGEEVLPATEARSTAADGQHLHFHSNVPLDSHVQQQIDLSAREAAWRLATAVPASSR